MTKNQQGQGLVEYAVVIGLVAVVIIGALILLGGGVGNVFKDTSDALGEEGDATPTPEFTPTPDAYTATCKQEFSLSGRKGIKFACTMDERIKNIKEIERVTISISPQLPDFHVVMFRFYGQRQTRFFCGPGGCRGFGGVSNYLYPYADSSDTLPDEWAGSLSLWLASEYSGRANYYRLRGDGTEPGYWRLKEPEIPWSGVLEITVVGKPTTPESKVSR